MLGGSVFALLAFSSMPIRKSLPGILNYRQKEEMNGVDLIRFSRSPHWSVRWIVFTYQRQDRKIAQKKFYENGSR